MIRRETDYGIRALLALCFSDDRPMPCAKIATSSGVPKDFAYKILQKLKQAGIVRSDPGRAGGFDLARQPEDITLKEIVEALQGPVEVSKCVLSPDACGRRDECPLSAEWAKLQAGITSFLREKSLREISRVFTYPKTGANPQTEQTPYLEESEDP